MDILNTFSIESIPQDPPLDGKVHTACSLSIGLNITVPTLNIMFS
jgi:hypothetical protein